MTDIEQDARADAGRVVIYANSNVTRGKFAAAAVHAALTAAGVHPGLPVIVLGAKPADIEAHRTVIRDAGRTEVKPGTVTAGTDWVAPATRETVTEEMVERAARVLMRDYEAEYDAEHLTWRDFADVARAALEAALTEGNAD